MNYMSLIQVEPQTHLVLNKFEPTCSWRLHLDMQSLSDFKICLFGLKIKVNSYEVMHFMGQIRWVLIQMASEFKEHLLKCDPYGP